jgi:hypothetical protein
MAQIAIKGHATRGKEVIEILEMLGGVNKYEISDAGVDLLYTIRSYDKFIIGVYPTNTFIIFTLEEFLEKYPYKVGDKVSSKYLKNYKIEKMEWEDTNNRVIYKLQGMGWYNTSELQPYKGEAMDKVNKAIFDTNAQCCDISNRLIKEETMEEKLCIGLFPVSNGRKEIIPCDGYEVVSDEGKFYVVKKQPQYPETYVECAKILERFSAYNIDGYKNELLVKLQELLICRDAYWKIAGEQMGLGKPWEPKHEYDEEIFFIYCDRVNGINKGQGFPTDNFCLSFPTAEMRDAFYENFKDLIESCKKLL